MRYLLIGVEFLKRIIYHLLTFSIVAVIFYVLGTKKKYKKPENIPSECTLTYNYCTSRLHTIKLEKKICSLKLEAALDIIENEGER